MKKMAGTGLAIILLLSVTNAIAEEKVRFVLDWVIGGNHTPYFVAIEKGYWKQKGLEVSMTRGFGGANTVKAVSAGSADVGFADSATALIARAKGSPVKIVSVFYGKAPFMLVSKVKKGIRKPKDLIGRSIGAPAGDAIRAVFPAFSLLAGIDSSKVKWVTMSPSSKTPSLLSNKVDAITFFAFEKALFAKLAQEHGQFNFMLFSDYGLDIYSNGLQAQDAYIQKEPQILRDFVRAVIRGYEWAFEHPKEANEIFAKHQPTIDKKTALEKMKVVQELVLTEEARKHCIGWISQEKLNRTRDMMFKAFHVAQTLDVQNAYTTNFLPCG